MEIPSTLAPAIMAASQLITPLGSHPAALALGTPFNTTEAPPSLSQLQSALAGTSFSFTDSVRRPRLVISVVADEKCGKTHFAHTAPSERGILYMGSDIGHEGVVEKFEAEFRAAGKPYGKAEYFLNIPNGASPSQIQEIAQAVWAREAKDFEAAVRSGVSTVIVDSATEIWAHLVLARFGKLSEVPQHFWGIPKLEYSQLIRQIYNSNTNLILLHKTKAEYKGNNATGGRKRAGFEDTGFLVQVEIVMTKTIPGLVPMHLAHLVPNDGQKHFIGTIMSCRQNTSVEGQVLVDPTFFQVAMLVAPEMADVWVRG